MIRRSNLPSILLLATIGVLTTAALSGAAAGAAAAGETEGSSVSKAVYRSRVFTVDDIYRSMLGPDHYQTLLLGNSAESEILWITSYRAEIIGPTSGEVISPEFMCHNNLAFKDMEALGSTRRGHNRLFTLSQGQMEVSLPDGFGIPVLSSEFFSFESQILNLNPQEEELKVRHEVTIEYISDRDLTQPMIPLFEKSAQGMVLVATTSAEEAHYGVEDPDPEVHGPGCAVGTQVMDKWHLYQDSDQTFTSHWVLPPGRQVNHTLVTEWLKLPFDTAIHYISPHLHPFAESLELVDLTTGESLYKAYAHASEGRIGLDEVDFFSSPEGIPVYKDHEYELISVYDNTSGEDQDAMAIMYIYFRDQPATHPDDFQQALRSRFNTDDTGQTQPFRLGLVFASALAMLGIFAGFRRSQIRRV